MGSRQTKLIKTTTSTQEIKNG